ncbi:hypothetical protein CO038_03280 [Candidatus Pacearchaeota archaeon CG_4_9_14_0_2_um_filter_39_13]|nr:MAG: hypothetical protein CO038_03280 [Candidatus Pacearchaeota archaeon CG_4_9_14_0_2_um_filter_39_13]
MTEKKDKESGKEEEGYTTIRVPISVKKQAEKLKAHLESRPEYKWIGTLALGAVLGYAISESLRKG